MNFLAQAASSISMPMVVVSSLIVIFLAIGIHEYAHAKVADLAGDPTPGMYGRVTLNLFKHFDLMGSIFIVLTVISGFGLGWGKPVPMDPNKMRNPRWDHFCAVFAGPLSNLLQAVVYALLFKGLILVAGGSGMQGLGNVALFLALGVLINVSLFCFNLLPLGFLDGMWIVSSFMPDSIRIPWIRFNLTYGGFLFIALVLFGQASGNSFIGTLIRPASRTLLRILLGADFDF